MITELRQVARFAEELLEADRERLAVAGIGIDLSSAGGARGELSWEELFDGDTNAQIDIPGEISGAEAAATEQAPDFVFAAENAAWAKDVAPIVGRAGIARALGAGFAWGEGGETGGADVGSHLILSAIRSHQSLDARRRVIVRAPPLAMVAINRPRSNQSIRRRNSRTALCSNRFAQGIVICPARDLRFPLSRRNRAAGCGAEARQAHDGGAAGEARG